ncbi:hypothetical protein E2320_013322 [Naja naja]|nr:hypothetical protein E2320_013322 [Naja naja]
MFLRAHLQLIVEDVVPDLLHVIPVGNTAILNGAPQGQEVSPALSIASHVVGLSVGVFRHTLRLGPPYDGRKYCSGQVLSSNSCSAVSGAVVHHKCYDLLAGHWHK